MDLKTEIGVQTDENFNSIPPSVSIIQTGRINIINTLKPARRLIDPPTPLYTGNEEKIVQLHKTLQNSKGSVNPMDRVIAITGGNGIGKSEFVRKFSALYEAEYQTVLWIDGPCNEISTKKHFQSTVSTVLGKDIPAESELSELLGLVVDCQNSELGTPSALVIFDDVVHLKNSKGRYWFLDCFSSQNNTKNAEIFVLLITESVPPEMRSISLDNLSTQESVDYFRRYFKLSPDQRTTWEPGLRKLADFTQGYPLAMELLAGSIDHEPEDPPEHLISLISDFLRSFSAPLPIVTQHENTVPVKYQQILAKVWKTAIVKLSSSMDGHATLKFLKVCSLFVQQSVPLSTIIEIAFFSWPETGVYAENYQNVAQEVVRVLEKCNCIKVERRAEVFNVRMHSVVKCYVRNDLGMFDVLKKFLRWYIDSRVSRRIVEPMDLSFVEDAAAKYFHVDGEIQKLMVITCGLDSQMQIFYRLITSNVK